MGVAKLTGRAKQPCNKRRRFASSRRNETSTLPDPPPHCAVTGNATCGANPRIDIEGSPGKPDGLLSPAFLGLDSLETAPECRVIVHIGWRRRSRSEAETPVMPRSKIEMGSTMATMTEYQAPAHGQQQIGPETLPRPEHSVSACAVPDPETIESSPVRRVGKRRESNKATTLVTPLCSQSFSACIRVHCIAGKFQLILSQLLLRCK